MSNIISPESVVTAAPDQISSDLAGEAVIMSLQDGAYYGLNEVGARIWSLLQQPRPVAAIRDALVAEYEIDPAQCEHEVVALLAALETVGLIEVR